MSMESHQNADAEYRMWMADCLAVAARRFRFRLANEPIYGWCDRSIGAVVGGPDDVRWLRVVSEAHQWAHGDYWTGNSDSNVIEGVAKPRVLDVTEWEEGPRRLRAEVMTMLPGRTCSSTDVLRTEIDLPDQWWLELRQSLGVVATVPTSRVNTDAEQTIQRIRTRFGDVVDLREARWETVHGDLHWANLFQLPFGLLDWEGWGFGPACLDAATLYCYSLLAPSTARRIHATFADKLNSPAGTIAQLYVAARLLERADHGDHPDLIGPLHALAEGLVRDGQGAF
jgi:hypothetical protein